MIKKLICIECPNGCAVSVDIEGDKITKISGNKCPKGEKYAREEIKNPRRILTTSVLAEDLSFKMISVRTNKPIPKKDLLRAMEKVKKIRIKKPVHVGDIIVENFMDLGADLIATRECFWKTSSAAP